MAVVRVARQKEEALMKRRPRNRGGTVPFAATLAILVGLLWSGAIDAEMKWTATMFGLALMTFMLSARD
jgi:hypothetical protein